MATYPNPLIAPPAIYLHGYAVFHGAVGEAALPATAETPLPVGPRAG